MALTGKTIEEFAINAHILMQTQSMIEEISAYLDEVPWVGSWSHQPEIPTVIATLKDLAQAASDRNEAILKDLGR